jgi:hypothetical protein
MAVNHPSLMTAPTTRPPLCPATKIVPVVVLSVIVFTPGWRNVARVFVGRPRRPWRIVWAPVAIAATPSAVLYFVMSALQTVRHQAAGQLRYDGRVAMVVKQGNARPNNWPVVKAALLLFVVAALVEELAIRVSEQVMPGALGIESSLMLLAVAVLPIVVRRPPRQAKAALKRHLAVNGAVEVGSLAKWPKLPRHEGSRAVEAYVASPGSLRVAGLATESLWREVYASAKLKRTAAVSARSSMLPWSGPLYIVYS